MTRPATHADIRKHFRDMYCFCRITENGHVLFRQEPAWHGKANGNPWLEGRFVEEYFVDEDGNVRHR